MSMKVKIRNIVDVNYTDGNSSKCSSSMSILQIQKHYIIGRTILYFSATGWPRNGTISSYTITPKLIPLN